MKFLKLLLKIVGVFAVGYFVIGLVFFIFYAHYGYSMTMDTCLHSFSRQPCVQQSFLQFISKLFLKDDFSFVVNWPTHLAELAIIIFAGQLHAY